VTSVRAAAPSDAQRTHFREERARLAAERPSTTAQWERAREALRTREAEQERVDRARAADDHVCQLARLPALPRGEYEALHAQAQAKYKGRQLPEGIIFGEMLTILDQRPKTLGLLSVSR